MRHPVTLRDATVDDAAALVRLWSVPATPASDNSADALPGGLPTRSLSVAEAASAIAYNADVNGHRILLAIVDGDVVGAAVHCVTTVSPVSSVKTLVVLELRVVAGRRGRQVELAIVSALAARADELGCELVGAITSTHDKDSSRAMAKLGFTQSAVIRMVTTSVLSARVSGAHQSTSRETGKLVAVRRTLRRRQNSRTAN